MAQSNVVAVKRIDGKWAIVINGQMVEGGFFKREAAERAAETYKGGK